MIKADRAYNVILKLRHRVLLVIPHTHHAMVTLRASSREEAMMKAVLGLRLMQRIGELKGFSVDATDAYVA